MLMREFGWTEKQLIEEVTIEKIQQIALIYDLESKKEKMSSSGISMPHIPNRKMR